MRFLVIGGLGYLGSIISDKLIRDDHIVDIFDLCLFDNADVVKDFCKPTNDKIGTITTTFDGCYKLLSENKYNCIVWCSNIDVEGFYQKFATHTSKTINLYETIAKAKIGLLNCFDGKSRDPVKKNTLTEKMFDMSSHTVTYWIPELYGPSLRMRWDTIINRIIYESLISKVITLGSDWMQKISICKVSYMADVIVDTIVNNEVKKYEDFIEGQFSLIELCFMIKSFLDSDDGEIRITLPKLDIEKIDASVIQLGNLEYVESLYELKSTVLNIKEQLTNGALPNFWNDKYNNEVVLLPLIQNSNILEKLNG